MGFSKFADYLSKIEQTPSRNEMTEILSQLLKSSSIEEVDKVCYLSLGRLAPLYEPLEFNLADKMMIKVLAAAYKLEQSEVVKMYKKTGDLGTTAENLSKSKIHIETKKLTVSEVFNELKRVAEYEGTGSQEKKITGLANLLSKLDPLSAKYVTRIPLGKLRLGFSDVTILDALSWMEKGNRSLRPQIEHAYNVLSDIGKIARRFKRGGVKELEKIEAEVGVPIRPAAAERLSTPKEILEKTGGEVAVEPKMDGFRCIGGFTPIHTKNKGYLSVKDVKVGDYVLTHTGKFRKVVAVNKRTIDKKERLFKLQTYLGDKFKISEEHRVLVWKGDKTRWIPIEEISSGEWVVFPHPKMISFKTHHLPNPHLILQDTSGYSKIVRADDQFYRFLGFWIGDGFTNNYHNTERIGLHFNAVNEQELAAEYQKFIHRNFHIQQISKKERKGTLTIYWRDKPFREWLTQNFRREWRGKMLPVWFAGVDKKQFMSFLQGWIESDGTPRHSGGYKIVTKERDLAAFVQILGLSHGIIIGLHKVRNRNQTGHVGTYYELIVPGTGKYAKISGDRIIIRVLRNEEVKRPDPRTQLYNLQVEEDESYCTGMVALHNCQIHVDGSRRQEARSKPEHRKEELRELTEEFPELRNSGAAAEGEPRQGRGELATQPTLEGFEDLEKGPWVQIYSRNLENTTHMFPDIVKAVQNLVIKKPAIRQAIFEGEALSYNPDTDEFLPFQETMQRKRKYGIAEAVKDLPLKVSVFDILFLNGKSLLKEPYEVRRDELEEIFKGAHDSLAIIEQQVFTDSNKFDEYFLKQLEKGLEGVVAKRLDGTYQAGARGFNWIKLKYEEEGKLQDTVDCVILGYYTGTGKRSQWGIGGFLGAVYDPKNDSFKTVSKVGSGLTDKGLVELKKKLDRIKTNKKPVNVELDKIFEPDTWVSPEIVVEVRADNITKSPTHTAGYALRFPRFIRYREDKNPQDATTVKEVETLFRQQKKR